MEGCQGVIMSSQNITDDGIDVLASDWNNRIRDIAQQIAKKIPEVGAVVSILIGFFWPQDKVNIFDALLEDITKLVKKEILEYEMNLHQSEIDALQVIMERYKAAQTHEKAGLLTNWITEADKLSVIFRESTNNIHLILPLINLAVLHLTGLRERLDFGKELYGEDNTEQWEEDLEEMYKTYTVNFLPDIFKQWKEWRENQVEIKQWVSTHATTIPPFFMYEAHASVEDTVTGEKKTYFLDGLNSTTYFTRICEANKSRMCNDAIADMAGCISTTFVFDKFLPDNIAKDFPKYDKKVFDRMFKGPYSEAILAMTNWANSDFRTSLDHSDYSPDSGPITKLIIREWNSIDAMQFVYANRDGQLAGNPNGGQRHDIDVSVPPIKGLHMGFGSGILNDVQIIYYDGTSSSTYGGRQGRGSEQVSANGPTSYRLSSWSYTVGTGPSNTYGPSVIQLEYTPHME